MKVRFWQFDLPFNHPFTIARGTKTHQPTFVVELSIGSFCGYGEAPAISYYNIPVEKMVSDLEQKKQMVEQFAMTDPERYWHYLHHLFPSNPFLVCALDMAGWDLWGKMNKKPLYQMWKTQWSQTLPATDYTIGIDTVDKMIDKVKEKPWPIYKIKLGTANDISVIEAIRKHTNAILRVDANAGWTLAEALEIIPLLKNLGVEFIEQPLEKSDWSGMKKLYEVSGLPLIADESCVFETDVVKCIGHFHGINIKLTKCSGITPARRMITTGRTHGLKIMMGCMNESTIGTAAIANFLPQLDYVDADGPLLLAQDLAAGIRYEDGRITIQGSTGLGIHPNFL